MAKRVTYVGTTLFKSEDRFDCGVEQIYISTRIECEGGIDGSRGGREGEMHLFSLPQDSFKIMMI